ncbi:hypothetical protein [Paenibacillus azoreducens]|uniref:Uncharacterized protein n=1 Tax=Paenibacillus azoreducens TaxID=116718 RepID=A0A920CQQ5_9BACL|nr:hypothetical protein [Paenibacillus azoreducens]GIO50126.1 hypothetical protein J34TS1_48910 [Paenibacillus azoreducens]
MMTQLIEDTLQLLKAACAPEAMIVPDPDLSELTEAAAMLQRNEVSYSRAVNLLALFTLLILARKRHDKVSYSDPDLTRKILDGDYFQSLYIQLALQFGEMELVRYLAPVLKTWYIRQALGQPAAEPLASVFQAYLQHEQASAAPEKHKAI